MSSKSSPRHIYETVAGKKIMKLFCSILLFGVFLLEINAQKVEVMSADSTLLNPGRCYFSAAEGVNETIENTHLFKRFVLEVVPPKIQVIENTYSVKNLKKYRSKDGTYFYKFLIFEPHLRYHIRNTDLSMYTRKENPVGYMVCLVDVPANYIIVEESEIETDSIAIEESKIIEHSKLIKRFVFNEPKSHDEDQIYFAGNNWSDLRDAIHVGCNPDPEILIGKIQMKLMELGYPVEISNQVDEKTKMGLFDFQKNNGLEVGGLTKETLEKLGIE